MLNRVSFLKASKATQSSLPLKALTRTQWKRILIAIIGTIYVASWVIFMQFSYQFNWASWWGALLWAALPTGLSAALGLYLYKLKYPTPEISRWFFLILILAAFAIPGVPFAAGILTLAPPTPPSPGAPAINSTLEVRIPGNELGITGLTEVKLWQTANETNQTAWSIIDLSWNVTDPVFYHDGWLNSYFFYENLSGYNDLGQPVAYWIQLRAWWKLSEWQAGTYTPPGWWVPWCNLTPYINQTNPYIEENETCVTWYRLYSGKNTLYLISEPYTLYGKVENKVTLQSWDSSDGAYADNYTDTWKVIINLPGNESYRGFNQEYDWLNQQYWGCWLIASSNCSDNIYRTYNDTYGTTFPLWFNVTIGRNIIGAVLNDSLITTTTYDIAFLLPTFNYNFQFQADIQIWNGTNGIYWYLGQGYETNIQIISAL
jgi:hypothetical protein